MWLAEGQERGRWQPAWFRMPKTIQPVEHEWQPLTLTGNGA